MNLRHATTIAACGLALATLSACGGGSSSSSAASSTSSSTPSSSSGSMPSGAPDLTAYRDCMSSNGVDLPDFGGGPPSGMPTAMPSGAPGAIPPGGGFPLPEGVDQDAFDAAQSACQDLAPQFGAGGPGAPVDIDASALAAFRSCLTDNGVPVTEGQDPLRDLDRSDPTVTAAFDTCSPLLPKPSAAPAG